MREAWQQITDGLAQLGGEDPTVRGAALLVAGLATVGTLSVSLLRRKPADRTRISVDAPAGEALYIQVGEDDDTKEA